MVRIVDYLSMVASKGRSNLPIEMTNGVLKMSKLVGVATDIALHGSDLDLLPTVPAMLGMSNLIKKTANFPIRSKSPRVISNLTCVLDLSGVTSSITSVDCLHDSWSNAGDVPLLTDRAGDKVIRWRRGEWFSRDPISAVNCGGGQLSASMSSDQDADAERGRDFVLSKCAHDATHHHLLISDGSIGICSCVYAWPCKAHQSQFSTATLWRTYAMSGFSTCLLWSMTQFTLASLESVPVDVLERLYCRDCDWCYAGLLVPR